MRILSAIRATSNLLVYGETEQEQLLITFISTAASLNVPQQLAAEFIVVLLGWCRLCALSNTAEVLDGSLPAGSPLSAVKGIQNNPGSSQHSCWCRRRVGAGSAHFIHVVCCMVALVISL